MCSNLVDVIIPTWNRGELLGRAIRSVLRQFCVNRVIVVDNGTRDAQLDGLDDSRICLIKTSPCIGASAARNIGANASKAPFVAFLDDDDYWQEGFLSHALPLFDHGADIVVGQLMRKSDGGGLRNYKMLDASEEGLRRLYYSNPGFGGQNFIIRRDFFVKISGFDIEMPASNDRDFAVRAIQAGARIYVQPESIAVLCDHDGERVRKNQVKGNYRFIRKHWWSMRWTERYIAIKTLVKRFLLSWLGKAEK